MSYVGNKPAQTTIPVDDSVTTTMLQDDAVTSAKIAGTTIVNADINASAGIANSKMATDTTNATNLATGTVPTARLGSGSASSSTFLTGAQTYAAVDTSGITANQDDIALLGFKVAANGSLARYNLVDQSIDAFEDASGVDASASTNEDRDSSGNYYEGSVSATPTVSGNYDSTGTDGLYTYYRWTGTTSGGTFTNDTTQDYEYLVVAGGGAGGGDMGGGGGAGGLLTNFGGTAVSIDASSGLSGITVGGGGAGASLDGSNGDNSVFSSYTSIGGGKGGSADGGTEAGSAGGSGGGAAGSSAAGAGTADQGYAGSVGQGDASDFLAGAGGGASEVGGPFVDDDHAGNGGDGLANAIDGTSYIYGGGGGGSSYNVGGITAGTGGQGGGGGGNGGYASSGAAGGTGGRNDGGAGPSGTGDGGAGGANTGSGGGGCGTRGSNVGGSGGSGIVIIRKLTTATAVANMTLVSNAQTAESAPTTGDLVITYTNGAGTATINTDLKAYISRDGSAYSSAVTLVSQGTTGGHTILTANGVDLSGITSGTSMRWKIETLNQSAAKQTRIQAVSLGWS